MKTLKAILLSSILILAIVGLFISAHDNCCEEETNVVTENLTIKEFLLKDQTDKNEYVTGKYVCKDFSSDVIKNARKSGFEIYEVCVHWEGYGDVTHSIVAFVAGDHLIHADVTQMDAWVCINFSTGDYKTYNIETGELVRAETIDWYFVLPWKKNFDFAKYME